MNYPFDCITKLIFVEHKPVKADVILIPGGSRLQLMKKAAELYKQGYASYILPSGGNNIKLPNSKTEWEYLKNIAISLGVPENAILKEDQAKHTFDNANLSWQVLQSKGLKIKKVILVCKTHHSRRALLTYQTIFPTDIDFVVCPIFDERNVRKDNWFLNQDKIDIIMKEVEKIGQYFGKNILDWANR
ncbi:MAG: YdcF family protein [Candidatus Falkowbacteria bacterium]